MFGITAHDHDASKDMQIVNDSATSQIKQIFAETSIAGTSYLLVKSQVQAN
jgi:hypothetical protein